MNELFTAIFLYTEGNIFIYIKKIFFVFIYFLFHHVSAFVEHFLYYSNPLNTPSQNVILIFFIVPSCRCSLRQKLSCSYTLN